jgi:hypothetical protein
MKGPTPSVRVGANTAAGSETHASFLIRNFHRKNLQYPNECENSELDSLNGEFINSDRKVAVS